MFFCVKLTFDQSYFIINLLIKCGDNVFHLNDKGWGMITFIIMISLLLCAILLISHLVNEIGGSLPLSVKKEDNSHYYTDIYVK